MPTLYITREDGTLGKKGDALCWRPGRGEKSETLPTAQVSDVIIIGQGNVTTQALHMLMDADIPVHYLDNGGRYKGSLTSGRSRGYQIRRLQYDKAASEDARLSIARNIIVGKLLNQRNTLLRYLYRRYTGDEPLGEACSELKYYLQQALRCSSVDEIRGVEGMGARVYFYGFSRILRPPWKFTERNRRPPRDPVNTLLSFGYTLLLGSVVTALIIAGLDLCVGFIHPEHRGRPSLALDLMEEFRSPVVDRLVVSSCNQGLFAQDDFQNGEKNAVIMVQSAKKKLLRLYSERMRGEVRNESNATRSSYGNHIRAQAAIFVTSLRKEKEYLPFISKE